MGNKKDERKAAAAKSAVAKAIVEGQPKQGVARVAEAKGAGDGASAAGEKLSNKQYEKELKKLHVELVKMQEWVREKGLKVCVIFEGRDGAGKGGTIKAITERVSPRVFRVIALPAG